MSFDYVLVLRFAAEDDIDALEIADDVTSKYEGECQLFIASAVHVTGAPITPDADEVEP